jgi:hypothetical protein
MSPTLFITYILVDIALEERSRKCEQMGLQIEDNCYDHSLLCVEDGVAITRGVEDADYMERKLKKLWKNGIFRYTLFRD